MKQAVATDLTPCKTMFGGMHLTSPSGGIGGSLEYSEVTSENY